MWTFNRKKNKTTNRKLRFLRNFLILVLIMAIGSMIAFSVFFFSIANDLPAPNKVVRDSGYSTKIYDRNGILLYNFFQEQQREPVALADINQNLINATIAIEDKDFYRHEGFDFLTILRIPYYYLTQNRVVGGSTLTQQLTKMMLLSNEKKVIRKFRELILSMQIEQMFPKEKILEMYLNEAPYGGNIHGANLAAKTYFSKSVGDLTIAEAAMLAGLPQSPTRYSPFAGRTDNEGNLLWFLRAQGVLRRMLEDGYINQAQMTEAEEEMKAFSFEQTMGEIKAPHFVFYVEDQLRELYGDEMVDSGGLQVYTTLDYELQASAEAIISAEIEKVQHLDISNGAALVLNPQTGEVLSMVGSKGFFNKDIDGQFNVTAHPQALRQPGSSIKPLVYLALLQKGATPATVFADVPTTFQANEKIDPYTPKNYDGKFRGLVNLRESLGNSYNIPAVKALAYVGLENFLSLAYRAGISTLAPTPNNLRNYGLALSLGGGEVRMIEMASAYSAFANGGYKVEPVVINSVKDIQGNTLYQRQNVQGARVFGEGETFLINDILSDNKARTAAFGANSLLNTNLPIAVKTGTTNSMRDNWAIGWSQSFLVHAWVGNNNNSPMKSVASGVTGASPIWRNIVNRLVDLGYKTPAWEVPNNVEKLVVNAISGYPLDGAEVPTKEEYYVKNTVGILPDPIYSKMKVCKGQNKIATMTHIVHGDYEEKTFIVLKEDDPVSEDGVNRWQIGIDNWIASQSDEKYRYPTEMCGQSEEVSIAIHGIDDRANYEARVIKFRVAADSEKGIERIEVFLNNERKEEKRANEAQIEWELERGVYEIKAKTYSRDGKTKESQTLKIGVGGMTVEEKEEEERRKEEEEKKKEEELKQN